MKNPKFRAWVVLEGKGKFIYFNLFDTLSLDFDIFDYPPIIQQFTTIKDDNNVDIYDGDLIKGDTYGPYRVFWDKKFGGWCSCCYSDSELIARYKSIVVTGHIKDGTEYEGQH